MESTFHQQQTHRLGLDHFRSYLLLLSLFFLICLGLGYPTLNRYRPLSIPGLSDSAIYYQLVVGSPSGLARPYMRGRILVPQVAKPFYWFARKFIPTIDPVAFGLLVANSLFCALGACLLVSIGAGITRNAAVALLGAMLYLLSFAVPNLQLAGLVDSGEACFMIVVTWTLWHHKWWLLPIWGILGALAKETFVPFAIVFSITWWLIEWREQKTARADFKWIALLVFAALVTITILHSTIAGQTVWPWNIAAQARADGPFLAALVASITDRGFWYVFAWLLPLGVFGARWIPRPWLFASLVTGVLALFLGAWKDMLGTVARPLFNTIGPMLSLSVAILLSNSFQSNRPE